MGNNLNMVISRYSEQILSELHFLRLFSDAPLAMVKTTLTKVSDTQRLHKCQYYHDNTEYIFVAHLCGEEEENDIIITSTTMLTWKTTFGSLSQMNLSLYTTSGTIWMTDDLTSRPAMSLTLGQD